ncbi:MAG: UbiA family prenyltransferase [Defluviitaleaceae bacterium]|nr:UbiA family prenyltransferase [Defluviitaleaceae bacterium]
MKKFLSFVEIQTKLATFFPFLAALAYVFYSVGNINLVSTLLYIPAALLLDMSVTAINNHLDYREENLEPHYSNWAGFFIILLMLTISAILSLYLVYLHGFTLLIAGAFCFFIGITYTFGPAPISKSPYSEVASGFVAGTVIMFIVTTINNPSFRPLGLFFNYSEMFLMAAIDLPALIGFGLITLPATFAASNISLANNICDAEKDRTFRYTLVHHIGTSNGLKLFAALYYAAYLAIVIASILGLIPLWSLTTLLTLIPVQRNIRLFYKKQVKSETFVPAVKNFVMIMLVYTLSMAIGGILYWI